MSEWAHTDRLSELVRRKRACLESLSCLGREQLALVERGEMGELLRLLASKQRLLADLEGIEKSLAPYRDERPQERVWRGETERGACALELVRCERLLADIVAQEKESEKNLRLRRDEAAVRLEAAHFATRARGAYQAGAASEARQLDLSSDIQS